MKIDIDEIPIAILMAKNDQVIYLANKRCCEIFDYNNAEELIGQNINILVPVKSRDRHNTGMTEYFKNPTPMRLGTARDLKRRRYSSNRNWSLSIWRICYGNNY